MRVPLITPLRQKIGDDLLLYLMFEFNTNLESRYQLSLDEVQSDPYLSSLCAHLFERYLMDNLGRFHVEVLLREEGEEVQKYYDFFERMLTERDSRQLAFYMNYLESWIEQSRDWEKEQPIPFSRFEFLE